MTQTMFKRIRTQPGDRLDVLAFDSGVGIPAILRANPAVFDPLIMPPLILPPGVSLIIPNPRPQSRKPPSPPWR